jgi:hypothetical protein
MTSGEPRHRRSTPLNVEASANCFHSAGLLSQKQNQKQPEHQLFGPRVLSFAKMLMLSFRRVRLFAFALIFWSRLRVS